MMEGHFRQALRASPGHRSRALRMFAHLLHIGSTQTADQSQKLRRLPLLSFRRTARARGFYLLLDRSDGWAERGLVGSVEGIVGEHQEGPAVAIYVRDKVGDLPAAAIAGAVPLLIRKPPDIRVQGGYFGLQQLEGTHGID